MEPKRRREVALAVLVVVLIAIVMWRVGSTTSTAPAVPRAASSPAGQGNQATEPPDPLKVDLESLESERPEPQLSERNPFRFTPRTPPSQPTTAPPPMTQMQQPAAGGLTPGEPVDAALPPIGLKFIGLVKSDGEPKIGPVAVLSDARGVYYGREGEIVEGRYRILRIGVESIDLSYVDGRGRQTIRFTGQ